jgi:predicted ATP-dependent endonuclease of OLD family
MDSGEITVNDIGCLVGKNESGKTALMQALYRLNPIDDKDATFSVTDEYPRTIVTDYEYAVKNEQREPAIVIKAVFALEDSDFENMEIPSSIFSDNDLSLSRGYDSKLYFTININETEYINWSLDQIGCAEDEQNKELMKVIKNCKSIKQLSGIQTDKYNSVQQCTPLINFINQVKGTNPKQEVFTKYVKNIIPKFLYFDDYYQMSGMVNIPKLRNRVQAKNIFDSDKPMLGLIELAGLGLDSFDQIQNTRELLNKLEGASNKIQRSFMKYWSQSTNISMQLDVRDGKSQDKEEFRSGANILTSIRDNIHQVTTMIGERSRGFIWFFSFIAWFSLQKSKHNSDIILLLDEPGLTLHAKAQHDLLRYIEEELAPNHQVIYTTHSPFMIDMKHTERIYIVEDRGLDKDSEIIGTKVTNDVLETGQDSLFPLQSALGYEITQSLFIGPYCLIVEGVSDLLYITAISSILEKLGRAKLDPKWTITPIGGIDKTPAFVSLFSSQKTLKLAVLIDFQSKDKQLIENLYKKNLIKKTNVKTFADYNNNQESDIEDLFEPSLYIKMVNAEYKKDLQKPIDIKNLNTKIPRIIVQIEDYLKANPLKNGLQFNHYRPARFFVEQIQALESEISAASIDVFEAIFKDLNSLLSSK